MSVECTYKYVQVYISDCLSMCMYELILWNQQPKLVAVSAEEMLGRINIISYVSLREFVKVEVKLFNFIHLSS